MARLALLLTLLLPGVAHAADGFVSPSVGGYERDQVFLDISQGARVSLRAYREDLPPLTVRDGRVLGWSTAVARAKEVDGIVPGLLASSVPGKVAYLGVRGADHSAAIAVADRAGRIDRFEVVGRDQLMRRFFELRQRTTLLLFDPPGCCPSLLARDWYVKIERPGRTRELLRASTPGVGLLTSATTRRPGLIATSDLAPTLLDRLGAEVPDDMTGHEIETEPGEVADLTELGERLEVIAGRRTPTLLTALGAWLLLFAALAVAARREQSRPGSASRNSARIARRTALRVALLGAMWLPLLVLLTAAIAPGKPAEALIAGVGAVALGLLTDRLVSWPRAPAIPAAAVLTAYALDFALGSPYSALSVAGPNPIGGARFFGAGNELEAILAVILLIGTGAAAARLDPRRGARALGLAALGGAFVLGPGRLGADVGAVIVLGAGGAAAVIACLPGRPSRRALLLAVVIPVAGVALLALIDVVSAGGAHLTSTLGGADGPGDLIDVVERRARISAGGISGTLPLSLAVAALLLAYGALRRRELLAPVEPYPALRAGITGAWVAVVVGTLANDSGPVFLLIGAFSLLVATGYARSEPQPPERLPSLGCV